MFRFESQMSITNRLSNPFFCLSQGVLVLITDFCASIRDAPPNRRSELFHELVKELRSHLARKPKLSLPQSEYTKRQKRIRKIKKELLQLGSKIKRYEAKELSLDDLENDERGALEKLRKCQTRSVKLYTELRRLQNKFLYFGNDEVDFSDVSENQELNALLRKELLKKFELKGEKPDYCQVNEIVEKFSKEKGVLLDSQQIFKRIGLKLKQFTTRAVESSLNAYLEAAAQSNEQEAKDPCEEDEELKKKLDSQNEFKGQLDAVVAKFVEQAEREAKDPNLQKRDEEDEETEDSESDSRCEDENELESISENEEEFISQISKEDGSSDEGSDGDEVSELEGDEEEAASKKSNESDDDKSTRKRALVDDGESECLKKVKLDDDSCIVLD